jgi:outer membrane lipoprotein-sorting protein
MEFNTLKSWTGTAGAFALLLVATLPISAQEGSGAGRGQDQTQTQDRAWSSDPSVKGKEIADWAKSQDRGFGDSEAVMKMVLTNAHGDTSERELRMRTLENTDEADGDKSMIIFDRPRDVEGTALLTHAHILDPDDQWLFLPSLKRVKRISSANKSGPFMGSEFAYEDFSSQEPAKFEYTWLRQETCPVPVQSRNCHVVERRPLYEKSGYTRQMTWIDTDDLQVRKVDYYDRKNALLKTLLMTQYRLYNEKYWRAHDLYMVNQNNKKTTRLTWEDYAFGNGFDERDFDTNSLKRIR